MLGPISTGMGGDALRLGNKG